MAQAVAIEQFEAGAGFEPQHPHGMVAGLRIQL
jgi:hypothetical protein